MSTSLKVRLWAGREKPVALGHPWIFSGAIEGWNREPVAGETVDVHAADGSWLARGFTNPEKNLAIRLYTWKEEQPLDTAFFAGRIDAALGLRERLFTGPETDSYRLVFSEADGVSGLIVDRYADALAVHVGALGLVPLLEPMLEHLAKKTGIARRVVSADREAVDREGIDPAAMARYSTERGIAVRIRENHFQYDVDIGGGQKTGFYLDQRVNRQRVAAYVAGRSVLSAYCYTGAFEIHAAAAGAREIAGLDSSESALAAARRHHALNQLTVPVDYACADVPEALRRYRDAGRQFDVIILDPPRFVMNAGQKEKGMRAYKDINLLGIKLLTPGGFLATFSCSGLVSLEDLKMTVRWAAKDAGRVVCFLETLGQPPDHPVSVTFPEGEYLTGTVCYVE
ncbi:MAG: class I SAM-dependent rRNA methyltransferase [bacterium]